MYTVSCIIQDRPGAKAWLCPCTEPCASEEAARALAEQYIAKFRCLSVWIDFTNFGVASTIWHRALVDSLGRVTGWDK